MPPTEKNLLRKARVIVNGEIDISTKIAGDFSISTSSVDRSSRQENTMETLDFDHTLDQMALDIYRAFHQKQHCFSFVLKRILTCHLFSPLLVQ